MALALRTRFELPERLSKWLVNGSGSAFCRCAPTSSPSFEKCEKIGKMVVFHGAGEKSRTVYFSAPMVDFRLRDEFATNDTEDVIKLETWGVRVLMRSVNERMGEEKK